MADGTELNSLATIGKSYRHFMALYEKVEFATKVMEQLGVQDPLDHLLQACYENLFNEEDRQVWDKWVANGNATDRERRIAHMLSKRLG